jgi:saccharopine dehydrogenase-like NADP-dependent oxidoreductase
MASILILGAGKVGRLIAHELSKTNKVTSVDLSIQNLNLLSSLNPDITTLTQSVKDLTPSFYSRFDLVVSAVPGFLGFKTLESIIHSKRNVVDISFMPENHLTLKPLSKSNNVKVIIDAGLAPGLSNLIAGYFTRSIKADNISLYVGGLPKVRKWPFEYQAPFSFVDMMEEYTRTARVKVFNHIVEKEPLSEVELIETSLGTLEAFNTDGVRSMLFNLPEVPSINEKTIRYPGYAEYINVLKSSGFFSQSPIEYKGIQISPFDFTSLILDKTFEQKGHDHDIVILKAIGTKGKVKEEFEMIDFYSEGFSAMARTTGFVATACVSLILEEKVGTGMFCLEDLGKDEKIFWFVLDYLEKKGVCVKRSS